MHGDCDKLGIQPHNERTRHNIVEGEAQDKFKAGHTVCQVRNVCGQYRNCIIPEGGLHAGVRHVQLHNV